MDKICNNCGSENDNSSKFCHNCGEELKSDDDQSKTEPQNDDNITCNSCGNKNDNSAKFCEECGNDLSKNLNKEEQEKYDNITCNSCGNKNDMSAKYCEKCGNDLSKNQSNMLQNKTAENQKTRNIILILVAVVAVLGVGMIVLSMGGTSTPTVTNDFGGITMLIPKGSNFVQTDSLPNYGITGGYIIFTNGGEHKDKVNSIMFTTIQGGGPPSKVVLDRVEGDVKIFKDGNGENLYYIEKNVGKYEIDIIGRDLPLMLEMINSVQINNPTLNI